jgi:hypothetical protein
MQIHEITKQSLREGFWSDLKKVGSAVGSKSALSNIGKGAAQGVTGIDNLDLKSRPVGTAATQQARAAQPATATPGKNKPAPGSILLVKGPGGMEYFKSHQGIWFEKPDSREIYSASGALQIKDPVKANKLNQLLPQAQTIYVKSASQGDTINFVPDSSGRTAKLAANRLTPKVRK